MLDLLFKYPIDVYAQGRIELDWSWGSYLLVLLAIAGAAPWLLGYASLASEPSRSMPLLVGGLRAAALALLLLLLLRPVLVSSVEEPVRGEVAVLLDDSLSMGIADGGELTRSQRVEEVFNPARGEVARLLNERFNTRYYGFTSELDTLGEEGRLHVQGTRSDLGAALAQIASASATSPVAAVVVVSDGGHEAGATLEAALGHLRASGVAVHTVGVGAPRFEREMEVSEVSIPGRLLAGNAVDAEVTLTHRGFAGESVDVVVEERGVIVQKRTLQISPGEDQTHVVLPLTLSNPGAHRLLVRVEPKPGEAVTQNNTLVRTVDVRDEPVDILHMEGEPRFEVKFLRRAVADDPTLRLVSLVQTAENKFYRLGILEPQELADGFPQSAEALFRYPVIVLGSVPAESLSSEQQELILEFVARRGGALLFLGGAQAFTQGGYARTPLAGLMPVVLPRSNEAFIEAVKVAPYQAELQHPVVRALLGGPQRVGVERLPPLTVVNPIRHSKPGATTLLTGASSIADPLIIFAYHRYGRGLVAAFPVRDSWRWQMHRAVPVDDETHELLWKQILHWLARTTHGRLQVNWTPEQPTPGQVLTIEAEALSAAFQPLLNAELKVSVTTPLGTVQRLDMRGATRGRGLYEAQALMAEAGQYELRVELAESGVIVLEDQAYLEVGASGQEFHRAELDRALLEHVARVTGGEYLPIADAARLVGNIDDVHSMETVTKRLPLWDVPALLLLLLILICLEWLVRRRMRLA